MLSRSSSKAARSIAEITLRGTVRNTQNWDQLLYKCQQHANTRQRNILSLHKYCSVQDCCSTQQPCSARKTQACETSATAISIASKTRIESSSTRANLHPLLRIKILLSTLDPGHPCTTHCCQWGSYSGEATAGLTRRPDVGPKSSANSSAPVVAGTVEPQSDCRNA